jgi:hypothetical protein
MKRRTPALTGAPWRIGVPKAPRGKDGAGGRDGVRRKTAPDADAQAGRADAVIGKCPGARRCRCACGKAGSISQCSSPCDYNRPNPNARSQSEGLHESSGDARHLGTDWDPILPAEVPEVVGRRDRSSAPDDHRVGMKRIRVLAMVVCRAPYRGIQTVTAQTKYATPMNMHPMTRMESK